MDQFLRERIIEILSTDGELSSTAIQKKLGTNYYKAVEILEAMEKEKTIVSKSYGSFNKFWRLKQ